MCTALFKLAANYIEHTVKIYIFLCLFRSLYKSLTDFRHTLQCLISKYRLNNRNLSPSQKFQTRFFCNNLKHLLRLSFLKLVLRKEEHTYRIASCLTKLNFFKSTYLLKEIMWNLSQNSDTVTCLFICIFSCSMFKILYYFQGVIHKSMCLISFNIYNSTDTAVVMFKIGSV